MESDVANNPNIMIMLNSWLVRFFFSKQWHTRLACVQERKMLRHH